MNTQKITFWICKILEIVMLCDLFLDVCLDNPISKWEGGAVIFLFIISMLNINYKNGTK